MNPFVYVCDMDTSALCLSHTLACLMRARARVCVSRTCQLMETICRVLSDLGQATTTATADVVVEAMESGELIRRTTTNIVRRWWSPKPNQPSKHISITVGDGFDTGTYTRVSIRRRQE